MLSVLLLQLVRQFWNNTLELQFGGVEMYGVQQVRRATPKSRAAARDSLRSF